MLAEKAFLVLSVILHYVYVRIERFIFDRLKNSRHFFHVIRNKTKPNGDSFAHVLAFTSNFDLFTGLFILCDWLE